MAWTYLYYWVIDPALRDRVGRALGVRIVWTYDARHYLQQGRYKWWRWGIAEAPADHVVFAEFIVHALCVGIVMIVAGMWPVALVYIALVRHWTAPLTLYACLLLAIPIFSIYWTGRYRPVGV
jgi:hypothetical protein